MKMIAIAVERADGTKLLGSWVQNPEDRNAGPGTKLELSAKQAEEVGALLTRLAETAVAESITLRCMNCGSDRDCFDGSSHPRLMEPVPAGGICDICEKPTISTRKHPFAVILCADPKCFQTWHARDKKRTPPRGTIEVL